MRRIFKFYTYCIPILFLILISCDKEGNPVQVEIDEVLLPGFTFDYLGSQGNSQFNQQIVINQGECVDFRNDSYKGTTGTASNSAVRYVGELSWEFEGGDPTKSTSNTVSVCYKTPGKYDVTLKLAGDTNLKPREITEKDLVVVNAKPEPEVTCYVETATSSDGRTTTHIYDENNILIRADKFLNEVPQEYSSFSYVGTQEILEKEEFRDPQDQLLGTIGYEYNNSDHIILEKTEAADGTLIRDRTFTWNDEEDYIISAVYREPDGLGGLATFDVEYVYDNDKHNISSEIFTQNGVGVGQTNYEFDNHPKVFTELLVESSPLKFNRYNATSITSIDANGAVISQQTSTFEYGADNESCGRPISESRTTNGTEVKFNWTYNVY